MRIQNISKNAAEMHQQIDDQLKQNREQIIQFENIELISIIKVKKDEEKKSYKLPFINKEKQSKIILKQLNGYFAKGLNAILGSSGAGKTSFLNVLAKRIKGNKRIKLHGNVLVNNVEYSYKHFNNIAGYVMQDNYLLPSLTVYEYLKFTADMKLNYSEDLKIKRVEQLLKLLNLKKCQDTRIGDTIQRGISGGEQKRVSIGVELIGQPQILFLDEPTSGLDSHTSYQIINLLREMAQEQNMTVVFTIHQPSSDIWNLFDKITLMVEGQFVYQGLQKQIIPYFSNIGFQCPVQSNPADYFMQEMNSSDPEKIRIMIESYQSLQNRQILIQSSQHKENSKISTDNVNETNKQKVNQVGSLFRMKILLQRQLRNLSRNKIMIRTRLLQCITMALFLGLNYLQLSRRSESFMDSNQIAIILFVLMIGIFYQSMNPQVIAFSQERPVFVKEESSRLYSTGAYFISKILPEVITCSAFALLSSLISFWMIGLTDDNGRYLFFLLVYVLQSNIGNVFGILSGSLFKEPKVGIAFSITVIIPQLLFGGLFKNRGDLPTWIGWVQYVTPQMYAFNAVVQNEFSDTDFKNDPIQYMELDFNKWICVLMLVVLFFAYGILGFLCLLTKRTRLQ